MRFDELNDMEQLVVLQSLYNAIGERVSTKNPDSLRAQIDQEYRRLYEQTGSKSFDVKLGGDVVGTYSIRFSKEKPSEERKVFEVIDTLGLAEWLDKVDQETITHYVALNLERFAEFYFNETGELPDGCDMVPVVTPAVEKSYIGGLLKVDAESVAGAIQTALPNIAGLIAGDTDE